jgi:hypothetical protein
LNEGATPGNLQQQAVQTCKEQIAAAQEQTADKSIPAWL